MIRERKIPKESIKKIPHLVPLAKKTREIECLYLFGSAASDSLQPLSDLDLAVLLNRAFPKKNYLSLRLSLMDQFSRLLETDELDLVLLNQAPLLLAYEVIRSGQILFERNRAKRIDYECLSLIHI